MTLQDALHNRQADSRARKLILRMQTLKDAKQLGRVLHIETSAIVTYEVNLLLLAVALGAEGSQFDPRIIPPARELEGVGKEIGHDLLDQAWVTFAIRERGNLQFDPALGLRNLQFVDETGNDGN